VYPTLFVCQENYYEKNSVVFDRFAKWRRIAMLRKKARESNYDSGSQNLQNLSNCKIANDKNVAKSKFVQIETAEYGTLNL
jgi:hypothetical protein